MLVTCVWGQNVTIESHSQIARMASVLLPVLKPLWPCLKAMDALLSSCRLWRTRSQTRMWSSWHRRNTKKKPKKDKIDAKRSRDRKRRSTLTCRRTRWKSFETRTLLSSKARTWSLVRKETIQLLHQGLLNSTLLLKKKNSPNLLQAKKPNMRLSLVSQPMSHSQMSMVHNLRMPQSSVRLTVKLKKRLILILKKRRLRNLWRRFLNKIPKRLKVRRIISRRNLSKALNRQKSDGCPFFRI